MSISNCIAQLLAFVPCRLEHATYRSHEAKMVSGPFIHEGWGLPSHSPCVQQAHRGEALRDPPSEAPLVLNSPKKTDTYDSACICGKHVAAVRCLRKLTARLSPCPCLVRYHICFVAAACKLKVSDNTNMRAFER
ncbi:hypothetical protein M441DRAFT_251884 [Trichoderma asperellum CBS 433.97]|uniref:Uncharacterized protein n=1 Tax=Trichoderma asperellum (strain ATCC 204424 / CBS 433.97 / NBRC 101777) TaxID=1042311 RepID=A0A2T3Z0Y8_TRIA4|nr:hypothetical protein M441DRAFT_251884 [Trichoderma asperellum CBS 433.97]PTB38430.1 hypothetical protein M441DRAFT_251884 [Trichoderma asperellum CBS 433.97]